MSFKGVKKHYLLKRKSLLQANKHLKNVLAKIRKGLIQKAAIFRALYFVVLHNKKNMQVCQLYDEMNNLQRQLLTIFEHMNRSLQIIDLKSLFTNVLQNEKLVCKELRQFYKKSVREMLRVR